MKMNSKANLLAKVILLVVQACKLCSVTPSSMLTNNYTDLHSLIAFKSTIEYDPNNVLSSNWTANTNFCHWRGVTCNKRLRVTILYLQNMALVGTISPRVGNLTFLEDLNLRNNRFHGQVIKELWHLSRLKKLRLGFNNLRGEIPISLSLCQKLEFIGINDNELTGTIPKNLTTLPRLQFLVLGRNKLTGTIPTSFGNLSALQYLGLEQNEITGTIPKSLTTLPQLLGLYLGQNKLTGTIPTSFANMSTLRILALGQNRFHGTILNELAPLLGLQVLILGNNHFTGTLPPSLFNISSLEKFSIANNFFTGELPKDAGPRLPNLTQIFLGGNQLTGNIHSYWSNMSRLTYLSIEINNFNSALPASLPLSLQVFDAHHNNLQGEIPREIGALKNLTSLDLSGNRFSGTILLKIKGMERMQQLLLGNNNLEGPIPKEICYLSNLGELHLENNRFFGSIPDCIGNLSSLQSLLLGSNALSSTIPQGLWSLVNLVQLNLSSNSLHGNIGRDFKIMKSLNGLDFSRNQLSGNIPDFSRSFQSIIFLDLSWNSFSGHIPKSIGKLISLVDISLSNNNLSGQIPKSLESITFLKHLNLSYNKLSGEIPSGGPFSNFTTQSFIGNQELCGESISKPCPTHGLKKSRNKFFPLSYILPSILVVTVVCSLLYVCRKRRRNNLHQNPEAFLQKHRIISYHELSHATNGFSYTNFLGSGGFGHVYKGILSNGEVVAVKLLNLAIDGAIKSFDAECKVLRTVRHKNLVKVISTCTNPELRALVLEYIPNGSLEKWLYSHNYCLSFLERVSIMLNVAVAMDYLHCGQLEPVIHCDLKPSNVLLDEDMVAHVCDFGIAKFLAANKTETQTNTLGTFGYIAPEYGAEGRVSMKGDAYSYGIMLLETFTRKKPTDEIFSEELSLRQWVSSSVANGLVEVVDENLLNTDVRGRSAISSQSNFLAVLDIGLGCSRDVPDDRFEMKDVVTKLNKIKLKLLLE